MSLVPGALQNPPPHGIDLFVRQLIVTGIGRRHAAWSGCGDAFVYLARIGIAGGNRKSTAAEGGFRVGLSIQPQVCLTTRLVGSMTRKTPVREYGPNVAIILEILGGQAYDCGEQERNCVASPSSWDHVPSLS